MEKQLLLVLLSAAATSLIVAAVLSVVIGTRATRQRFASIAAVLGLIAGCVVGARIGTESWPMWPPAQARAWWVFVPAAAGLAWLLAAGLGGMGRIGTRMAAVAGAIAGTLLILLGPLAGVLSRIPDPGTRWLWRVGIGAAVLGLSVMAARGLRAGAAAKSASSGDRARVMARLRDDHWATLALGLTFGVSAMGLLFSAQSMTLCLLGLAMGGGWGGVALVSWLMPRRIDLAGAGVAAVVAHAALWLIAHFFGQGNQAWVLVVSVAAPMLLILGAIGPLARRGGWIRVAVVTTAVVAAAGSVPVVLGPSYMKAIREIQPSP